MRARLLSLSFALIGCQTGAVPQGDAGGGGLPLGDGGGAALTYHRDVEPIMQAHCQSCHTPGGIGPFSLLTYQDVYLQRQVIAPAVASKKMPPWMPSGNGCQELAQARVLTDDQIATISAWATSDAAEGDPADAPPPLQVTALPWVDAMLDPGADYTPPVGESDHFQCFLLDPKLTQTSDLIGYDVEPGMRAEVHHVVLFAADAASAQAQDDATPNEVGWTCYGGPGTGSQQIVAGWVPGSPPSQFPKDTGIPLAAGQVLVMQLHYNNSAVAPGPDRTHVLLQYARSPVAKKALIVGISNNDFSIPPGAMGFTASATLAAPANATIWGVVPHMHTLGTSIRVEGDEGCLVDIPKWDFHWQQFYYFSSPNGLPVSKGMKTTVTCSWDNPGTSAVTFGETTEDEMCLAFLYVTAQ